MEENMDKNDILKAVVLLLLGFVVGFATHAFISVTGTDDVDLMLDEEESSIMDTDNEELDNEDVTEDTKEVVKIPATTETIPVVPEVSDTSYNLMVTNQPAGDLAYVSEMQLQENAWIAIREEVNGAPGTILGAGWFPVGTTSGVVELLRPTVADASYYAVIFIDNGNKEFEYKIDTLISDILVKFLTY